MRTGLLAMLGALLLGGCGGSLNVKTDWNTTVDFTKYKTFDFKHDTLGYSNFTQQRIRGEITNTLMSKGVARDSVNPELIVVWRVKLSSETQTTTVSTGGYAYGPAWGGYGGYWGGYGGTGMTTTSQQQVPLGALTVAMVDSKTNHLIWRGEADAQLNDGASNAQLAHDAITRMFQQFPTHSGVMPGNSDF